MIDYNEAYDIMVSWEGGNFTGTKAIAAIAVDMKHLAAESHQHILLSPNRVYRYSNFHLSAIREKFLQNCHRE
jgi:hypothetical protein